ncbi:hypothetical protein G3N57_07745 [Paraburkholderia sp. Se-20369]|nr:hypothetical protein [Paraburkholderia sp. Se-20369]
MTQTKSDRGWLFKLPRFATEEVVRNKAIYLAPGARRDRARDVPLSHRLRTRRAERLGDTVGLFGGWTSNGAPATVLLLSKQPSKLTLKGRYGLKLAP